MNIHTAHQNEIKRLYRSRTDKSWLGVCGGLAEYLGTDATLIRLAWVIVTILTGFVPGLLGYLVAAIIMPVEPLEE